MFFLCFLPFSSRQRSYLVEDLARRMKIGGPSDCRNYLADLRSTKTTFQQVIWCSCIIQHIFFRNLYLETFPVCIWDFLECCELTLVLFYYYLRKPASNWSQTILLSEDSSKRCWRRLGRVVEENVEDLLNRSEPKLGIQSWSLNIFLSNIKIHRNAFYEDTVKEGDWYILWIRQSCKISNTYVRLRFARELTIYIDRENSVFSPLNFLYFSTIDFHGLKICSQFSIFKRL